MWVILRTITEAEEEESVERTQRTRESGALSDSVSVVGGGWSKRAILEEQQDKDNPLTGGFVLGGGPDSLGRAACKAMQVRSMVM